MVNAYNTRTKKVDPLALPGDSIRMFVCGPTVYDYIHIGNARTFVVFDVVARALRAQDIHVTYIQNITDIDNKIIERAHTEKKAAEDLARTYTEAFLTDTRLLGITSPTAYVRATDVITAIIQQIQTLIAKRYAYAVPARKAEGHAALDPMDLSDVYFDVRAYETDFPNNYGVLSGHTDAKTLVEGARVALEENKRSARDFVLWKAKNYAYEPSWDSPWGNGRPGWHIEDTAISETYFGAQYDLHGGAQDLIFPHHEAEIAQQQAASGKTPFVRHWMHAGFLHMGEEKMSKSLGNFVPLRTLLETYSPQAIRLFLLGAHYRSPLTFSYEALDASETAVTRIRECLDRLVAQEEDTPYAHKQDASIAHELATHHEAALTALNNDFDTPAVIAILFESIRAINTALDKRSVDMHSAHKIFQLFDFFDTVLGVIPRPNAPIPKDIQELAEQRQDAKRAKAFTLADELRDTIIQKGYAIDDTPTGYRLKRK
ncbi:MAG: cysteine--tRNA ligase [Patescibacteria group bacterium]